VTAVDDGQAKAERFLRLHDGPDPLLLPNAWDPGSARLLASLGFEAIATTSGGFAATLGRLDYSLSRDEALAHAAAMAAATDLPVSADLEDGFADDPEQVAATLRLAVAAGLAGCSIEDFTRRRDAPIHDRDLAVERVRAAAEIAHAGPIRLVLTARAENHLHDHDDLADTIERLKAYAEAGADVLYAPGLTRLEDIRSLVASLDRPVNVLLRPRGPSIGELAEVGVRRISVGGALAYASMGALVETARALRDGDTSLLFSRARTGGGAARHAFS
jgi:2-methylisocitrate lyase-like PEP mutase family enzyme